jgi:hypothetical protein
MSVGVVAAAAAAARGRRQVLSLLRDAGALSAEQATSIDPASRLGKRALERMVRAGVVHETSPGVYWLDEAALAASIRRRVALVLAIDLTVIAVAVLIFVFSRASR